MQREGLRPRRFGKRRRFGFHRRILRVLRRNRRRLQRPHRAVESCNPLRGGRKNLRVRVGGVGVRRSVHGRRTERHGTEGSLMVKENRCRSASVGVGGDFLRRIQRYGLVYIHLPIGRSGVGGVHAQTDVVGTHWLLGHAAHFALCHLEQRLEGTVILRSERW